MHQTQRMGTADLGAEVVNNFRLHLSSIRMYTFKHVETLLSPLRFLSSKNRPD